jgi:hypothetical protein
VKTICLGEEINGRRRVYLVLAGLNGFILLRGEFGNSAPVMLGWRRLSCLTRSAGIISLHQLNRQVKSIHCLRSMSSKISAVSTKNAPPAMAVYSQAIVANGFVYCSGIPSRPIRLLTVGQIPADASGNLIEGDIKAHTVPPCLLSAMFPRSPVLLP